MMSERELLSQLIVEADYRVAGRTIPATRNERLESIVDYLISHGVHVLRSNAEQREIGWIEIAAKVCEKDEKKIQIAPLSNIAGAKIYYQKGYGKLEINVPADVAENLTNGSGKYNGGLLLIDSQAYKEAAAELEERSCLK